MSALALSLKLSAIKTLSAVQRAINILKSAGPGAWYDPSDLTTLFQDSAGTTPVTAVEQPVGLILDKSQGLVLGPELVTNGDFSNGTTGWSAYNAVISAVNGTLKVDDSSNLGGNSSAVQLLNLVAGRTYLLTFDVVSVSGTWSVGFATTDSSVGLTFPSAMLTKNTTGPQRLVFTYDGTRNFLFMEVDGSGIVFYDNISVKELPGNHLIQPTATSRPTLSSLYNLALASEAWGAATGWSTDRSCTITHNAIDTGVGNLSLIVPDATSTTRTPYNVGTMMAAGSTRKYRLLAKAKELRYLGIFDIGSAQLGRLVIDLQTGVVTQDSSSIAPTVTSIGSGVYEITFTKTIVSTGAFAVGPVPASTNASNYAGDALTGDGVGGMYIGGVSSVPVADASLPYQRINTATDYDYDFSKFPPFLRFDGVDDSLYSAASVDFTSTDKMTVFAGVHKASDAATAALVELSANALSTNGAFVLGAPFGTGTATYDQYVRGTAVSGVALGSTPAPTTNVITAVGDIAGDLNRATKNGTTSNQIGGDLGTGNFGNHVLNVGRRNNASLPFNGRIYQLAIKGKSLSAGEVSTLESYVNSKTKAF